MIFPIAVFEALLRFYVSCPKCKKIQHFKGRKKGDSVACKKCGYPFVLK
jgi:predicted RNA-binding Zn-ribbon protein involved in translation (DUF1610 family)